MVLVVWGCLFIVGVDWFEVVDFDDFVEDGFGDGLDGLEEFPLIGVRFELVVGIDEEGFVFVNKFAVEGSVNEVAVLDLRGELVVFGEDFGVGLVDFVKNGLDDEPGFGCQNTILGEEEPDVEAFGFTDFDVGGKVVVSGSCGEFERELGIVVVEVDGDEAGSVID